MVQFLAFIVVFVFFVAGFNGQTPVWECKTFDTVERCSVVFVEIPKDATP